MTERQERQRRSLIYGIADTIQRVYGDATQTAMDIRAAREIWEYLISQGVADLQTVAAIVSAAGGRVEVQDWHLLDPPDVVVMKQADPPALVFKVQQKV